MIKLFKIINVRITSKKRNYNDDCSEAHSLMKRAKLRMWRFRMPLSLQKGKDGAKI